MANIKLEDLKLETENPITTFDVNGKELKVKYYISTEDKSNIIYRAGRQFGDFGVDEILAETMLYYDLIKLQTNIELPEEIELSQVCAIVDNFNKTKVNGVSLLTLILDAINEDDFNQLTEEAEKTYKKTESFIQANCTANAINTITAALMAFANNTSEES